MQPSCFPCCTIFTLFICLSKISLKPARSGTTGHEPINWPLFSRIPLHNSLEQTTMYDYHDSR